MVVRSKTDAEVGDEAVGLKDIVVALGVAIRYDEGEAGLLDSNLASARVSDANGNSDAVVESDSDSTNIAVAGLPDK